MIKEHPAKLDPDRRIWFGNEVEGALSGLYTAFISAELTSSELTHALLTAQHFFITETFETYEAWDWLRRCLLPWVGQRTVTVGRYPAQLEAFFQLPCVNKLRLMIHVLDAPWITYLRPGDEIAIGVPYKLVTFEAVDGRVTLPEAYEGDYE